MLEAAQALLGQIEILSQPPTNARSFLVIDDYGRGMFSLLDLPKPNEHTLAVIGTHVASGLAFKVCSDLTTRLFMIANQRSRRGCLMAWLLCTRVSLR